MVLSGLRAGEKVHEGIITEQEYPYVKYHNNIFIIDKSNNHRFKNIKNRMKYFHSENAKLLSVQEIIKYLTKNSLV